MKGYIMCLFALLSQVLRNVPPNERVELFFEEQHEYYNYTNLTLKSFFTVPDEPFKTTSDGKPKIALWDFIPKRTTILTDPADYLAFAAHELWTHPNSSKKAEWCSTIFGGNVLDYVGIMVRKTIREVVVNTQVGVALALLEKLFTERNNIQSKDNE